MRFSHVADALMGVVVLAMPVHPRADEGPAPGASGRPRVASSPARHDLAPLDLALERAEHRIEIRTEKGGRRSAAGVQGGVATTATATAVENGPRSAVEPPMWGDPSGIDLRHAASVIYAAVAPRRR